MKDTEMKNVNLLKDMRILLRSFQFFGIAPFAVIEKNQWIWNMYQVFHFFLILVIFINCFLVNNIFQEGNLSTLVGGLVFTALIIAHIVTLLQALCTRKQQKEIFDILNEIDHEFNSKLHCKIDTSIMKRKFGLKTIVIALLLLSNDILLIISNQGSGLAMRYYHTILSFVILRVRFVQVIFYVTMATERIKVLNEKLEEMIHCQNDKMFLVLTDAVNYSSECGNYKSKQAKIMSNERIIILKHIYGRIWDMINLVNDCFGWSLLAIITQYFMDFTSNGYWLFLALERVVNQNTTIICLCHMCPVAFILSILAWSSSDCVEKSELTGNLVHKLEKSVESEQYNSLVSEFSLQLIHEPISISANGFFNINFELLGSMAAATVTYLVILIQFQQTESPNKNGTTTVAPKA